MSSLKWLILFYIENCIFRDHDSYRDRDRDRYDYKRDRSPGSGYSRLHSSTFFRISSYLTCDIVISGQGVCTYIQIERFQMVLPVLFFKPVAWDHFSCLCLSVHHVFTIHVFTITDQPARDTCSKVHLCFERLMNALVCLFQITNYMKTIICCLKCFIF